MYVAALILAAGKSQRLGQSKPFVKLGTSTLLERSIELFSSHPRIDRVVIVCNKHDFRRISAHSDGHLVVVGGRTRQASCRAGLEALEKEKVPASAKILIHNVANPFATKDDITRVLNAARRYQAVAVAQEMHDSLKVVSQKNGGGMAGRPFVRSIDRSTIRKTQTPQCLPFTLALKAHRKALRDGYVGTDDIELAERVGMSIKLVPCSEQNFKITTPYDLQVARALIRNR